jgi:SAM-dependent methyltransferase
VTHDDDPFGVAAAFYDLDVQGYDDDIELYRAMVDEIAPGERAGGVLELGCGTGRVALALARAGHAVTGVDVSPAMLDVARRRVAEEAGLDGSVDLLDGDMRTLDLGRRFAVVLVPLGGLQHMENVDDLAAAFATIARHLAPGGIAAIDVEPPHAENFASGQQPLVEHWTREWPSGDEPGPRGQVTKLVSIDPEPSQGLRHVTWHFDVQPPEGPLRRLTQHFSLRVITLGELELAARLAGLQLLDSFGGYDGEPYDDGSDRLVATFAGEDAAP